jgi:hypothetical protein
MQESDVEKLLEEFRHACGLSSLKVRCNEDTDKYLKMDHNQLKKMCSEECACASYLLSQESAAIKLEINRFKSIKRWAERSLKYLAAPIIGNYGTQYTPYEYRLQMVVRENPLAFKLQKLMSDVSLKIDQLEDITMYLRGMAKSLETLLTTKRG